MKKLAAVLLALLLCLPIPTAYAEEYIEEELLLETEAPEEEIILPEKLILEDVVFEIEDEEDPEPEPEAEPEEEIEPSFALHTPEDIQIEFGLECQPIGFVSVSDVVGVPEWARVMLVIESPAFVNLDDPDETIPFTITDAEGNDEIILYDETDGAQPVELFIHVSPDAWSRASLSAYAVTVNYSAVMA